MVQAPISVPKNASRSNLIAKTPVDVGGLAALRVQSADDGTPATFGALSGAFNLTNDEFGERFLPWVRLAVALLQRDSTGAEALVRDMAQEGGEGCLNEADRAWTACAELFSTVAEFVEAAQVRVGIVRDKSRVRIPGLPEAGEAGQPSSRCRGENRWLRLVSSGRLRRTSRNGCHEPNSER